MAVRGVGAGAGADLSTRRADRRGPCGTTDDCIFDELKVLGCVEGQNLKIVGGGFDLREDQYSKVAAELTKAAPEDACERKGCRAACVCDGQESRRSKLQKEAPSAGERTVFAEGFDSLDGARRGSTDAAGTARHERHLIAPRRHIPIPRSDVPRLAVCRLFDLACYLKAAIGAAEK
jgi:hypothetical protein